MQIYYVRAFLIKNEPDSYLSTLNIADPIAVVPYLEESEISLQFHGN